MNNLYLATFAEVASYIGYILLALLILLVMITVHELGHYIAGKIFKFKIDEFSIGFGPKLFSKKKKDGEVFSLRAIPLGGFCAFTGEDSDEPDSFNGKKPWQRIIVLISGALMNYLLALVLIVSMFAFYGDTALVSYKTFDVTNTEYTKENSLLDKDVIIKANGKNVYIATDLMNALSGKRSGEEVPFLIIRSGEQMTVNVKMRRDANFKNVEDMSTLLDVLGIYYQTDSSGQMVDVGLYSTGVRFGFFQTLWRSFDYSVKLAGTIFAIFGQLITGSLGLSAMGGTVTTISVTATAIKVGGLRNLLNIASFIGVNLAVFNLLPIPALDGSRVVFTAVEWIRGKPINRKVENVIHTVGLVLLLLFAVILDLNSCF